MEKRNHKSWIRREITVEDDFINVKETDHSKKKTGIIMNPCPPYEPSDSDFPHRR